jgi:hypothetical protein
LAKSRSRRMTAQFCSFRSAAALAMSGFRALPQGSNNETGVGGRIRGQRRARTKKMQKKRGGGSKKGQWTPVAARPARQGRAGWAHRRLRWILRPRSALGTHRRLRWILRPRSALSTHRRLRWILRPRRDLSRFE